MARSKEAARRSCHHARANGSRRTKSIVADAATFRVAASTVAFTMVMLAIPTLMALLKCWGVW